MLRCVSCEVLFDDKDPEYLRWMDEHSKCCSQECEQTHEFIQKYGIDEYYRQVYEEDELL